jgi:hypothetical protein
MGKPQTQRGYIYERNKAFHIRYNAHESGVRKQRSYRLCSMDQDHPSKDAPAVVALAEDFMLRINTANIFNDEQAGHNCPICGNRCARTIEQKFAKQI